MRLERLELVGFKSFAQKTVLDFPAGIVGIVGPNGSGKSNIIDAIRWLLGEREAKNIRGAKAEDLIFSGTATKTRMGMAQAALIFDNHDHFFPVDFAEVRIERRVNRDGLSTYLMNGAEVRLKDLIDFFAKSRLGTKGFTIINQGDSDLFVRATPDERRAMLEEMLGLREFQLKKHDALQKLKNTKINTDKVEALLEEITPHLRMLKRQTAKWEKHDEYVAELKSLENQYFGLKLRELEKEAKHIEPERRRIDAEITVKETEVKKLVDHLGVVEKGQPQGDKDFELWQKKKKELLEQRSAFEKELGGIEVKIEFILARPKQRLSETELSSLLEEAKKTIHANLEQNDLALIKQSLRELFQKIDIALKGGKNERLEEKEALEASKKKIAEDLRGLERELSEVTSLESMLANRYQEFNASFKKAYEAVEEKKNELHTVQNERSRISFAEERIATKRQDLEHQLRQIGRALHDIPALDETGEPLDESSVERRILRLRGELATIGDVDEAVMKEAKETEERHTFLQTQLIDLKKAAKDLHHLIKELDFKIHTQFTESLKLINEEFNNYFRMMFNGGKARLILQKPELVEEETAGETENKEGDAERTTPPNKNAASTENNEGDESHPFDHGGIVVDVNIPRKRITGLDMLSGGERSLVSIAALFALISVSPPPFLVLDEADAALDEENTRRFANLVKEFAKKTQFIIVTHNRATMEASEILYGITMKEDGTSRVLSLKLEETPAKQS